MSAVTINQDSNILWSRLPDELYDDIMKRLDIKSFLNSILVCSEWTQKSTSPKLRDWKLRGEFGKASCVQLNHYMAARKLTFVQALKYSSIIQGLNSYNFKNLQNGSNNQPFPACHNGWQAFFGENGSTIRVYYPKLTDFVKSDNLKLSLSENSNDSIQVIACNTNFVFGLCTSGKIVQWDVCTREQVGIIDTKYSALSSKEKTVPNLYITDQKIVLAYQILKEMHFEFIPYHVEDKNTPLLEWKIPDDNIEIHGIRKNHIYFGSSLFGIKLVYGIYDLEANTIQPTYSVYTEIYNDIYPCNLTGGEIIVYDPNSTKCKKSIKFPPDLIENKIIKSVSFIFKNFLICFSKLQNLQKETPFITIWDIELEIVVFHQEYSGAPTDILSFFVSNKNQN